MMSKIFDKSHNRRELIRSSLRLAVLGVLGFAGGRTFLKRRKRLREGKCINSGICRGCKVFKECGLPQALSAKQFIQKES